MRPQVGDPVSDWDRVGDRCTYSARPGQPRCTAPATAHFRIDHDVYGPLALAACDVHAVVARGVPDIVAEHPYEWLCALPGTMWIMPENRCVLDDSGVEPVRTGAAAQEMVAA